MSSGNNRTIRFINTLQGEGNNELIVLDRGNILEPQPLPGSPGDCSSNEINTICGFGSGINITTASQTTLFGIRTGEVLQTGQNNSFFGHESGKLVFGGVSNTLLGGNVATGLKTGSVNICIGNNSASAFIGVESRNIILYGPGQANDSDTIRIGESGVHETKTFIYGIHSTIPAGVTEHVIIDSDGHLGSTTMGGLFGITDIENTFLGLGAGTSITTGDSNVVSGFNAFNFATTAGESVILGAHACENLLNTGRGVFIGANSGLNADMTSATVAVGFNTLQNLSGSTGNTCAYGFESLQACTSGGGNSAYGALTLKNLTTSVLNTAVGRFSGTNIKDGCDSNCLIGAGAGIGIGLGVLGTGVGSSNTACGTNSLFVLGGIVAGDDFNTALGRSAGGLVTGSSNLYLGHLAGSSHGDPAGESDNIYLANSGVSAEQSTTRIGTFATITDCFIAGILGTPTGTPVACIIDPLTGKLGVGQVQMNGSGDMSGIVSMEMVNVVSVDDTVVQFIDVDASGFAPTTGIGIALETGAINTGDVVSASLNVIDQSDSLGGRIFGNAVLTTSSGSAEVHSVGAGVNVNPIYQQSGSHTDADTLLNIASNVTVALSQGGAGNIVIFSNNADTFTVQDVVKYSEIEFILDMDSSNGGISPTFEFSSGSGPTTWTFFSPQDGTNGMRNSGSISYDLVDLIGWIVGDSGNFEIRITRTRVTINSLPRADLVQVSATTIYEWNKDGDVNIRSLNVSTNVAGVNSVKLEGTGAASGFNCDFTGFVDIDSSLANTQAIKIISSNAAGGMLIQTGSGGHEITGTGPIDIVTNVNSSGVGISIRSTGAQGKIDLQAGSGGVVVIDSDINGLIFDDSTSSFNATMKASPLMTASYNMILPIKQGTVDGQALVNNSSGTLRWDNPVGAFPNGWINGLGMTNGTTTDTDKDINTGECRDDTDVFNIVVSSLLTVDNTTTGVDGLDTGSLTADTWYTIWVIADTSLSNSPASLMSLSETAPTLPSGYDVQRRVGWARTDSTSDWYKAFYGQSDQSRVALWDVAETLLEVLTDGGATVYTVVDCSEFIPPVTGGLPGYINTNHSAGDDQDFLTVTPTNLVPDLDGLSPVTNPRANRTFGGASGAITSAGSTFQFINFSDDAGEILYGNSTVGEDSDIWIIGYIDVLSV